MNLENPWGNECFYCECCGKPFRSPLYDISKEYQYTRFYDSPRIPEIQIMGAEVIANYCSSTCRESHRNEIFKREKIQATYPNIGPTESCSRCHGPVLMTCFHLAFVETVSEQNWDQPMFRASVINTQVISVVCNKCEHLPPRIARAVDWD
jgi:hypothetical protein